MTRRADQQKTSVLSQMNSSEDKYLVSLHSHKLLFSQFVWSRLHGGQVVPSGRSRTSCSCVSAAVITCVTDLIQKLTPVHTWDKGRLTWVEGHGCKNHWGSGWLSLVFRVFIWTSFRFTASFAGSFSSSSLVKCVKLFSGFRLAATWTSWVPSAQTERGQLTQVRSGEVRWLRWVQVWGDCLFNEPVEQTAQWLTCDLQQKQKNRPKTSHRTSFGRQPEEERSSASNRRQITVCVRRRC